MLARRQYFSTAAGIPWGNLKNVHQRMREPHLGTVDGTVARRLDQRQNVMVPRVLDDLLEGGLR